MDKVTNKAYRGFWTCRGTFGKTCGLKPKVMYWNYTLVVRPIVTYAAAAVWWHLVNFKTSKVKLSKFQRMACLGITGAMKTALTATDKDRTMDNVQQHNNCTNVPLSRTFRLYMQMRSWRLRPQQVFIDSTAAIN
jgi:hypothetical protein